MTNSIKTSATSNNNSFFTTHVLDSGVQALKQASTLRTKSQLHKVIVGKNNSPDYLAINIYWDTLRSWYNPKKPYTKDGNILYISKLKTKGIYLDYAKLSKTHCASKETIRQKLVKLEELGLINRSFQHKETITTKSFNRLTVYVWQQTPHFFNEHGIDRNEVEGLTPQTNYKYISEKYKTDFKTTPLLIEDSIGGVSKQLGDTKELTEPFSIEKDRSVKSNFLQNSVLQKEKSATETKKCCFTVQKELKDFYPLSETDVDQLQVKSGRSFSLNAMNEILLDMSRRLKDRLFKSKKAFLSYMSIAFKNEMRDAVKVSNKNFRISGNKTTKEVTIAKQEEYLSQIEYSLQVSPEWHLKKKLCSVLEREKAYNLLSSYKGCRLKDGIFEIHLMRHVELTSMDQDIILNQAKASHERTNLATGKVISISSLKIITPLEKAKPTITAEQRTVLPTGVWGSIRQALIGYFGKDGEALDKSWFSKLEPEVDEEAKKIILKTPNEFFKDWIKNNYLKVMEKMTDQYKISLS